MGTDIFVRNALMLDILYLADLYHFPNITIVTRSDARDRDQRSNRVPQTFTSLSRLPIIALFEKNPQLAFFCAGETGPYVMDSVTIGCGFPDVFFILGICSYILIQISFNHLKEPVLLNFFSASLLGENSILVTTKGFLFLIFIKPSYTFVCLMALW